MSKRFYVQVSQLKPEWKVTNKTLIPVQSPAQLDARNISVYTTESHDFVSVAGRQLLFDPHTIHFCGVISMDKSGVKELHEVITLSEEYKERYEGVEFNLGLPINGNEITERYNFAKKLTGNFSKLGLFKKSDEECNHLIFAKNPESTGFSVVNGVYAIYNDEVLSGGGPLITGYSDRSKNTSTPTEEYLTERILDDIMANTVPFIFKYIMADTVFKEVGSSHDMMVAPNNNGMLFIHPCNCCTHENPKLVGMTITSVINNEGLTEMHVVGYSFANGEVFVLGRSEFKHETINESISIDSVRDASKMVIGKVKEFMLK